MTRTEFTVDVPGIGMVDVVAQDTNGDMFWDLFGEDGTCLNEGTPLWTLPTQEEVLDFFRTP
jgi:hypothetical protein